jgi:hypothetical protein
MVDLSMPPYALGSRVDVWNSGFAGQHQGRALALGSVLVVQSQGNPIRFHCGWGAWKLSVDGLDQVWDRDLILACGAHSVALTGRVPAQASGGLPVKIQTGTDDLVADGASIPVDPRYGLQETFRALAQDRPMALSRLELLPLHRFSQPEGIQAPFAVAFESHLTPSQSGTYLFRVRPPFTGRVTLGGKVVFDALDGASIQDPVVLRSGQPQAIRIDGAIDTQGAHLQTMVFDVRPAGDPEWSVVPVNWLRVDRPNFYRNKF